MQACWDQSLFSHNEIAFRLSRIDTVGGLTVNTAFTVKTAQKRTCIVRPNTVTSYWYPKHGYSKSADLCPPHTTTTRVVHVPNTTKRQLYTVIKATEKLTQVTMADIDPVGTTPLPLSSAGSPVRVWFDDHAVSHQAQTPQALSLTKFPATRYDDIINGALVTVSKTFAAFLVKNGLIRILDLEPSGRTLVWRKHQGQRVTDIRFFNKEDVFASVSGPLGEMGDSSSLVVVSRVFWANQAITVQTLVQFETKHFCFHRLVWHPFDCNVRNESVRCVACVFFENFAAACKAAHASGVTARCVSIANSAKTNPTVSSSPTDAYSNCV